ncbi:uncharacterized protein BDW43DRAFT_182647 [Aspergillus alliaceus]|uniref:uncharacterized protein n=1 Tax=Petromyces alliaceus TaxID=209559 RepID=UPI0012A65D49|nr:uncharacterized protein BDW43DRAFT_182647 [Aspergillus alliaceus]KAB8237759.1 hypothetical protein BDW43DRAFT_182647 [Aspergillus alliaceus]
MNLPKPDGFDCSNLRTGTIGASPVPRPLMHRLLNELDMTQYTSSYSLTEASPTCFNHDRLYRSPPNNVVRGTLRGRVSALSGAKSHLVRNSEIGHTRLSGDTRHHSMSLSLVKGE